MLRKLPIKIVKGVFMIPFFREEKLSDEEWLAWKIRCARNLGFKGEFNKAEKYILKSLEINHKANGNQLNSALLYTFLGGIYEEYGNYNKSIELHL